MDTSLPDLGLLKTAAVVVLVWAALPGPPAHAQPADRPPLSAVERRREVGRRLDAGTRLLRDRSWAAALTELEVAHRLRPEPRILVLIAQCHDGLGHLAQAASAYEGAVAGPGLDERQRNLAQTALRRLAPRLHALTVRTAQNGVEVAIDGAVLGTAPLPNRIFVTPGLHRLEARRTGQRPVPLEVTATAGGESTVQLETRSASTLGTLVIESLPPGLTVEVDGWNAGETPVRTQVEGGRHRVVLVRPGHRLQSRTVEIQAEAEVRVNFNSTARDELPRPALLHVVGTKLGTELRVDRGAWQRLGTSADALELQPGSHTFLIRDSDRRTAARSIDIHAGDRFLLRATPGRVEPGLSPELRWGAVAVAGTLVAGAGLTGLLALLQHSSFDDDASRIEQGQFASREDLTRLQSNARDARDAGEALSTTSDVLLVAGGLVAVGALGLFLFGQEETTPPALSVRGEIGTTE